MKRHSLWVAVLCGAVACSSQTKSGTITADAGGGSAGSGAGGSPGAGGSGETGGRATGGSVAGSGGSSGAGGVVGTGGAGATGGAGGAGGAAPAAATGSVVERNAHPSRDGHFVQPALTRARAAGMALTPNFTATYTGQMWASPLYAENGPGNRGAFFAATINNDVIAFDEATGQTLWTRNLGAPVQMRICGGTPYPTVGIFGTPVIDATSRTLYVVNPVGPATITGFFVHALSLEDGAEKPGWPKDVSQLITNFAPAKQNQRSALSLVGGILYVAFGGHWGDCSPYQGRLLAINVNNPAMTGNWATSGERAAIWAPGGMASDGNGVFLITGDGPRAGGSTHQPGGLQDSNAVLRATGLAVVDRSAANYYYPARWEAMDRADADFGSNSPIYLTVPGAPRPGYVAAVSKDGHFYLLDATNLGGMDGHVSDLVFSAGAMSVRTSPTAYTTAGGVYVAVSTEQGAMCPGAAVPRAVVGISIPVTGGNVRPAVAWCAPSDGVAMGTAAPIATTTDGTANPIVWYISGTKLVGVDGTTGANVVTATGDCAGVMRFTAPIAAKGRILTGGDGRLCSWSAP
jgi:hypothetical protein